MISYDFKKVNMDFIYFFYVKILNNYVICDDDLLQLVFVEKRYLDILFNLFLLVYFFCFNNKFIKVEKIEIVYRKLFLR